MSQAPNAVTSYLKKIGSVFVQAQGYVDSTNNQLIGKGSSSSLNLTAAVAIKGTPGRICKVIVVAGGTASNGAFTLNDCATTGAAAAANEIITIPSGAAAGTIYDIDWPCAVGIVLSAVPSAGSPILSISYT